MKPNLRIAFVVVLTFVTVDCVYRHSGPIYSESCEYKQTTDGLLTECSGMEFTEVPRDLPQETTILDLKQNNISAVTNMSFAYLPQLRKLYLSKNNIQFVASNAFDSLLHLQVLTLDENNIYDLPADLFTMNHKLQVIDLSGNMLMSFPTHVFTSLLSLEDVDLSYNYIGSLNFEGFFPRNVSMINVSVNLVTTIHQNDFLGLSKCQIGLFSLTDLNLNCMCYRILYFRI